MAFGFVLAGFLLTLNCFFVFPFFTDFFGPLPTFFVCLVRFLAAVFVFLAAVALGFCFTADFEFGFVCFLLTDPFLSGFFGSFSARALDVIFCETETTHPKTKQKLRQRRKAFLLITLVS